jgi:hypothetical protein
MRALLFVLSAASVAALPAAAADRPAAGPLSGDEILSRLMEHNRQRESLLRRYSVKRTYSAEGTPGKVYAVEEVRMSYTAPGEKSFELISGHGSWVVRDLVFSRLRETEAATAKGNDRRDSSITPANYRFVTLGTEQLDGRLCYVVQATPVHKNKYLFEGRVWIDAAEFAVARIEGHPAANPSFWTHRIEFVRSYTKVGDFWLPSKDATVADIRLYGRKTLNIDHYSYVLEPGDRASGN